MRRNTLASGPRPKKSWVALVYRERAARRRTRVRGGRRGAAPALRAAFDLRAGEQRDPVVGEEGGEVLEVGEDRLDGGAIAAPHHLVAQAVGHQRVVEELKVT